MNIYGQRRRTMAYASILVILAVIFGSVAITQELAVAKSNSLSGGPTIGNTFSSAYAWNGTTFVALKATFSGTGNEIATFVTPAGFKATQIIILEKNPTYDVAGLLNTSNVYNYANIVTSTSAVGATGGHYINMTAAYMVIGHNVNGTSMTNHASKGWTNVIDVSTLFNANTNVLNQSKDISLFTLYRSMTSYVGYNIVLNDTAVNATTTMTLTFTQEFQHPFNFNIPQGDAIAIGVTAIVVAMLVLISESTSFVRRRQ